MMGETTAEVTKIGNHEVQRQAEDFFIYRFGPTAVTVDEFVQISAIERSAWHHPRIYSLSILDDDTSVSAGMISKAGTIYRHSPPRTSAFVVRRHYLQTTLEFALRTMRLLGVKLEVQFFADEPPAWAWLEERRKEQMTS